jgi:hypothetical protein
MVLNTLVWLACVIIVVILIIVLLRFLFGVLFLAPVGFEQIGYDGINGIRALPPLL